MFGNALGWFISAIIIAVTAAGIAFLDRKTRPTPPDAFGLNSAHAAPLALPPAAFLAVPATQPAVSSHQAAIDACLANLPAFESFARSGDIGGFPAVAPALQSLSAGAGAEGGSISVLSAGELISYQNVKPRLQALDLLGKVALRAALVQRPVNPKLSESILQDVFALGYSLFQERLIYEELDLGMRLMAESAAGLKRAAREDRARLAEIERFDDKRLELLKSTILPIATRIRTMDGRVIAANAGNIIHWAKDSTADRVWRVESVLALGRMRYSVGPAGTLGDQRAAHRALNLLQHDPDPHIQLAARAALALTAEEYRLLR